MAIRYFTGCFYGIALWLCEQFAIENDRYVKIAIENHHRNSGFSHETW